MPRKKPRETPRELQTLGARITFARTRLNLTQAKLAELAEVSNTQISRWEKGARAAGVEAATLIRLATALQVPKGWLIADEGDLPALPPIPVFRETDRRRKANSPKRKP